MNNFERFNGDYQAYKKWRREQDNPISDEDKKRLQEYSEKVKNGVMISPFPPMIATIRDEPKEEIIILPPPEELFDVIVKRGEVVLEAKGLKFILDENNTELIKILCEYFTRSEKFTARGYSLSKGLFLRGGIGTGKTFLLSLFVSRGVLHLPTLLIMNNFKSCIEIESDFRLHGEESLRKYYDKRYFDPDFVCYETGYDRTNYPFVFDDLGREEFAAVNFGNRINVMSVLIFKRYEIFIRKGTATHVTTNIKDAAELDKLYGEHIRSRIREMFNIIDITGKDRRK